MPAGPARLTPSTPIEPITAPAAAARVALTGSSRGALQLRSKRPLAKVLGQE